MGPERRMGNLGDDPMRSSAAILHQVFNRLSNLH
jgi:hypothetical protein